MGFQGIYQNLKTNRPFFVIKKFYHNEKLSAINSYIKYHISISEIFEKDLFNKNAFVGFIKRI